MRDAECHDAQLRLKRETQTERLGWPESERHVLTRIRIGLRRSAHAEQEAGTAWIFGSLQGDRRRGRRGIVEKTVLSRVRQRRLLS